MRPGMAIRQDYEYVRAGTCNLFVAVEPKGGQRTVLVTDHRAKPDFVAFVTYLLEKVYVAARRVHLVLDNLNTHFRKCFEDVLGIKAAKKLLRRVVFHYTPKHASWLNMAEIEIGTLDRQCLDRRLPDRETIVAEVDAWQHRRNVDEKCIVWSFTRQIADEKMARHYVSQFMCQDTSLLRGAPDRQPPSRSRSTAQSRPQIGGRQQLGIEGRQKLSAHH